MLRIFSHTPSFAKTHPETDLVARSAPRTPSSSRRIAASLRTMGDAWREALAAHRGYEHLTSRGIPHDKALRAALGIRSPANEVGGARAPAAVQRPIAGTRLAGQADPRPSGRLCRRARRSETSPTRGKKEVSACSAHAA